MFTSRSEPQALCLYEKRHVFFVKTCFGLPKPCLLRFRLAAGAYFVLKNDMPFWKFVFLTETNIFTQYLTIFVNMYQCTYLPYGTAYYTVLRTYLPEPYRILPFGKGSLGISWKKTKKNRKIKMPLVWTELGISNNIVGRTGQQAATCSTSHAV